MNVLLIQNKKEIADKIKDALKEWGFNIIAVENNGVTAIRKAETADPNLIITGISLDGGLSGIDTAEIICSKKNIPIIFTGQDGEEGNFKEQIEQYSLRVIKVDDMEELQSAVNRSLGIPL